MKYKFLSVLTVSLLVSCATFDNEHHSYLGIRAMMARKDYKEANKAIEALEKQYPNNEYLCELYKRQLKWIKNKKVTSNSKDIRDKIKKHCKS